MDTFFCAAIQEGLCTLPPDESHHAARVLRKRVGEFVRLIDGRGTVGTGTLIEVHKNACLVRVSDVRTVAPAAAGLTVAIAPTKRVERFEWFLEKAVELGVRTVVPILTERSERRVLKLPRLEKIVRAATKQSLRVFKPELKPLQRFASLVQGSPAQAKRLIAYCGDSPTQKIAEMIEQGREIVVFIGPEGGFTPAEYELALAHGLTGVSLGPNRLRTETAGLYAAAVFRMINDAL